MKENNWNQFTKRITINAPALKIYQSWTTQNGLESWFLRKALFTRHHKDIIGRDIPVEEGDTYEWTWFGYPETMEERHTVLAANGKDYLQFRFSGGCIVSVHIKTEYQETICELVQDNSTADENKRQMFYIECGNGWIFYMANLKSILEGGIDLRNKNEKIEQVINS
jgi:uncharacterized protein YndB with AHSA1/START domain